MSELYLCKWKYGRWEIKAKEGHPSLKITKGNSYLWIQFWKETISVSCLSLCPWPFILILCLRTNNIFWLKLPSKNVSHLVLYIIIVFLILNRPFQFQKERTYPKNGSFSLKPRELEVIRSNFSNLPFCYQLFSCNEEQCSSSLGTPL